MNTNQNNCRGLAHVLIVCALALGLAGCSGDDGTPGATGAPGPGVAPVATATALTITVTGVSIASAPVVNFKITNQDGVAVAGLTLTDLRFAIAKLIPGSNGAPSRWQSYINTPTSGLTGGYVRGNRENNGTLVDNKDGTYTYTFKTNISDPAQTCPTTPCIDPDGNAVDTSYNASLTHRVAIQTRGALPMVNGIYTFRPSDGATTGLVSRQIVKTATCNECHNKLSAHDARIEMDYCVMCHNPGSTAKGQIGTVVGPTPVDFRAMVHKIHYGDELPSVLAGGDYGIFGFSGALESYKTVAFPQDIKNCTKCHDGTAGAANVTAQGDNWKTQPSKAACSSCHDAVHFDVPGVTPKPYQTESHIALAAAKGVTAPPNPGDDTCISCHVAGGPAGSIEASHPVPVNVAATKFKFNILEICGTPVRSNPSCASGAAPIVKFSVTDPTGATTHLYGNKYDVVGATVGVDKDPEFGTSASLNVVTGWMSGQSTTGVNGIDFTNNGGAGNRPSRANSSNAITGATDNGDGTFSITLQALPGTPGSPVARSGVIAIEGHPRGQSVVGIGNPYDINVPVAGAVAYFGVDANPAVVRRIAVDVDTKCDKCHNQLSLHGANRAENAQLCVICHNPRGTDVLQRLKDADGLPIPYTLPDGDGKAEESIDLKRLIHGIHAARRDDPSTTSVVEGHGFREKGYGIQGRNAGIANFTDFGHIRFPGILNDCTTCHNTGTYELAGKWEAPLQNGILAVTVRAVPDPIASGTFAAQNADQSNDLMTTPTAAVCSACHDGALAEQHMKSIGGAKFGVKQAEIDTSYETCSVCHGPGRVSDVKVVHGVP